MSAKDGCLGSQTQNDVKLNLGGLLLQALLEHWPRAYGPVDSAAGVLVFFCKERSG